MKAHSNRVDRMGLPGTTNKHRDQNDEAKQADDKLASIHFTALIQKKRLGRNFEVLCL